MSETLISALVQAPFVLVMAYLVHRFLAHLDAHDAEWRDFAEQTHEVFGERLDRLSDAIERLSDRVISHDAATRSDARGPVDFRREQEALRLTRRER